MTTKKWVTPVEGYVRHLYVLESNGLVLIELRPAHHSIMTFGGDTNEQIVWCVEWPQGGKLCDVYGLSNAKQYVEQYYERNAQNTGL